MTYRSARDVRSVAPFWIVPSDSSSSTWSFSDIITKMAAARCAPTRSRSETSVGDPTRHMMSLPILVRRGFMPRSAKTLSSISCISFLSCWSVMITMLLAATLVEGGSTIMSNLNSGRSRGKKYSTPSVRRSFPIWYCRRKNAICTTARSVASFQPRIKVCPVSATFVLPDPTASRPASMPAVMKPTTMANTIKPKSTRNE
mmetsp:Transcript_13815/g.59114  ORF Transcript_13815/g.59114 Transcript_13815/m.59114 type:complete len:201 (-) Transcript_13815:501-1103(-)